MVCADDIGGGGVEQMKNTGVPVGASNKAGCDGCVYLERTSGGWQYCHYVETVVSGKGCSNHAMLNINIEDCTCTISSFYCSPINACVEPASYDDRPLVARVCPSCGAPVRGDECDYCGSVFKG